MNESAYKKALSEISSVIQALESAPETYLVEIVRFHTVPTVKRIIAGVYTKKTLWQKVVELFKGETR